MTTQTENAWWISFHEVVAFARVLHDSGRFASTDDLFYMLAKPWKWDSEHAEWVANGRPAEINEE